MLRLTATVDGERVRDVKPVIGYMHRGYEKIVEARSYPQVITLINRIDWVSGFANEVPFVVAAEKLMVGGKQRLLFAPLAGVEKGFSSLIM